MTPDYAANAHSGRLLEQSDDRAPSLLPSSIEIRWRVLAGAAARVLGRLPGERHEGAAALIVRITTLGPDDSIGDDGHADAWRAEIACTLEIDGRAHPIDAAQLGLPERSTMRAAPSAPDRLDLDLDGIGALALRAGDAGDWRVRYMRIGAIERFGGGRFDLAGVSMH